MFIEASLDLTHIFPLYVLSPAIGKLLRASVLKELAIRFIHA